MSVFLGINGKFYDLEDRSPEATGNWVKCAGYDRWWDFANAAAVSKMARTDASSSSFCASPKLAGMVNRNASHTASKDIGLPDAMTVTKARMTPSWNAAIIIAFFSSKISASTFISFLLCGKLWIESALHGKRRGAHRAAQDGASASDEIVLEELKGGADK